MATCFKLVPAVLVHLSASLINISSRACLNDVWLSFFDVIKVTNQFVRVEIVPVDVEWCWDLTTLVDLDWAEHGMRIILLNNSKALFVQKIAPLVSQIATFIFVLSLAVFYHNDISFVVSIQVAKDIMFVECVRFGWHVNWPTLWEIHLDRLSGSDILWAWFAFHFGLVANFLQFTFYAALLARFFHLLIALVLLLLGCFRLFVALRFFLFGLLGAVLFLLADFGIDISLLLLLTHFLLHLLQHVLVFLSGRDLVVGVSRGRLSGRGWSFLPFLCIN